MGKVSGFAAATTTSSSSNPLPAAEETQTNSTAEKDEPDTTAHRSFLSYAYGDETPEQIFGGNVARLREVKRRWDPGNVFCWGPDVFG
jgi:hypothetical protein